MIIKKHLCGLAVAYEPKTLRTSDSKTMITGRPQGSLYGQQKRKIADAVEYMRLYPETPKHKPVIFVATSPGFVSHATERSLISKLTANLTHGYGCKNFVWVREFTKKGYPHFHFVAELKPKTVKITYKKTGKVKRKKIFLNAKRLSLYWSGLFNSTADNSIRLGTKPDKNGKRQFYVTTQRMAWYMTKYFSKSIGKNELTPMEKGRSFRRFHVSKHLAAASVPLVYGEEINEILFTGLHQRDWVLSNSQAEIFYDQERPPPALNPKQFKWNWTGYGMTYTGVPKSWKTKTITKTKLS